MKTATQWEIELLAEITRLKSRNKLFCFHPDVDMTDAIAKELERKLSNPNLKYTEVTFKKCKQCVNKYDITIGWTL